VSARERYPVLYRTLSDLEAFSARLMPGRALRPYQVAPARAILDSIDRQRGDQFAIVFSRQSGKDEMLAQLLALLLVQRSRPGGTIVVAAPTLQPQAAISRDRLRDRLLGNPVTGPLTRVSGPTVHVGRARCTFVSAAPTANARGQTADLLLVANEAQDIAPDTWDAVFDPMAASSNATTLFLGTAWSRATLLARQLRHLEALAAGDGRQRTWRVPWEQVAAEIPAYGDRVRARIAQLGERHPFIRTEYCLEELEGDGGLFPPDRIARMRGEHPRLSRARAGFSYALLIDVGGEEEAGPDVTLDEASALAGAAGRRDSTALTVVEVEPSTGDSQPVYRVVDRRLWTGVRHSALHAQLVDLARRVWQARWLVVDATGVGAGLASFLASTLAHNKTPVQVIPFTFTSASKSRLGWDFLGLIDSGRFLEYADPGDAVTAEYHAQLRATTFAVVGGPGNVLRWSVPTRDGHDDLVISAALCAVLDGMDHRDRIARGAG